MCVTVVQILIFFKSNSFAADVFALMSDTKARYTDRGLNVLSKLGEMMQARMEDGKIKVL